MKKFEDDEAAGGAEIELRTHCVSVRLSPSELNFLDENRATVKLRRGSYLRVAALSKLPEILPEINRSDWIELARSAGNLNQIARHLNQQNLGGGDLDINEIRKVLADFRAHLVGARQ